MASIEPRASPSGVWWQARARVPVLASIASDGPVEGSPRSAAPSSLGWSTIVPNLQAPKDVLHSGPGGDGGVGMEDELGGPLQP